jgi:hypothetical protein
MAEKTIENNECWCAEVNGYLCSDCEKNHNWKKLTNEQRIFAIRWVKAEKRLDAKKSIELHNQRVSLFPEWDFTPEDVPDSEWRRI